MSEDLFPEAPTPIPIKHEGYKVPPCPYGMVAHLYHLACPALPMVLMMSPTRQRTAGARWREVCAEEKFDSPAALVWFGNLFHRVSASDFLMGRTTSDRHWRADFDWIMAPRNFYRILEGRYDG